MAQTHLSQQNCKEMLNHYFGCKPHSGFAALNNSLPLDSRLYADDLDVSKAYAEALHRAGYLTADDCDKLKKSLELIRFNWIEQNIRFLPSDWNVHAVNERLLVDLSGELGLRLLSGRSYHDQIVTDLKLWMRKAMRETLTRLCVLIDTVVEQADIYLGVVMPGYTHMQPTQTVQYSHWLLSHAFAWREDCLRLVELRERANVLPLGSGPLAGNPLAIDRLWLAERLGFAAVTANSMHTVGDRDFVVDFIYCCSAISLHLSRLAEDLIIYSTQEFDFIRMTPAFGSRNSLIPQKCYPDSLELIRGAAGLITGSLTGIMMTIKGTPSSYNQDLQLDKQYLFQAYDKLSQSLDVALGVMRTMQVQRHQMETALTSDMLASDWAYYLVRKGVPFQQAHQSIARVVQLAQQRGVRITEVPLGELQTICPAFGADISSVADCSLNVEHYSTIGGTATISIVEQIRQLKSFCKGLRKQP